MNLKCSLPCLDCQEKLESIGFKEIYCSTSKGTIEKFKLKNINTNHVTSSQMKVKEMKYGKK